MAPFFSIKALFIYFDAGTDMLLICNCGKCNMYMLAAAVIIKIQYKNQTANRRRVLIW